MTKFIFLCNINPNSFTINKLKKQVIMNASVVVAIMVTCAVLFALYVISGALVPFFLIHGHAEEDVFEGRVVAKTGEGCVVRLSDGTLCWLKTPEEPDKEILVILSQILDKQSANAETEAEVDPFEACFSINRAVLDSQGQKALILRRVTDDAVVCESEGELLFVECSASEQIRANKFDEEKRLYLSVKKEGFQMLPLCELT